jgi:hypothetical protein
MALERLQHGVPFLLDLWQHSHPYRYISFEILSYYARCWCEYKRTTVRLKRSLLNSWPIVENEPLRVVKEAPET